jgi:hypothetical protein
MSSRANLVMVMSALLLMVSAGCDGGTASVGSIETPDADIVDAGPTALPVFPGCEGFGCETSAGRGGAVLRVTHLGDDGDGSLRAALASSGPRVVVFEVSGTIALASDITLTEGSLTVAGQTAPSPGITIRGGTLRVEASDVLVQHLRFRHGDAPDAKDNIWIRTAGRVVFDHCSFSWATDENASISEAAGPLSDVTFSRSILSEGLRASSASGGKSAGFLCTAGTRVSLIRNLFAHNDRYNPQLSGHCRTVLANNVIYDWGVSVANAIYLEAQSGPIEAAILGNRMIAGSSTGPTDTAPVIPIRIGRDGITTDPSSRVYLADNARETDPPPASAWDPAIVEVHALDAIRADAPPLLPAPLTLVSASELLPRVLADVGARPLDRDPVDARIVEDVRTGAGGIIDVEADVGGFPALAENHETLDLPEAPGADDDGDGYTNLDEWLYARAAAVEP